jgi:DNA-binding HxlR family transcriptional regulator
MSPIERGPLPRAGTAILALLATPLNGPIVRALAEEPKRLSDLRDELGGPAQSTLRGNLTKLVKMGALTRGAGNRPSALAYGLTEFGHDLLLAVGAVEEWLRIAPRGPVELESSAGKISIKALIGGWSSTIVRALAARPLSLAELNKLIESYAYAALERRLSAMRLTGLIEVDPATNGAVGRRYTVSAWLRKAIGPLSVAARCERRHMPSTTAPIARLDIESAFLLVAPLVSLDRRVEGTFQLAVERARAGIDGPWAGAQLTFEKGSVASCVAQIEAQPRNWVLGTPSAWLHAVIGRDPDLLRYGGKAGLAREVLAGIHDGLFADFSPQLQSSSGAPARDPGPA